MQSETPRTDAEFNKTDNHNFGWNFARTLERELTTLQQENAGLLERDNQWRKELATLQQELAEATQNTKDLQYLNNEKRKMIGGLEQERDTLRQQNDRLREALKVAKSRLYHSVYGSDRASGLSYEEANEHGIESYKFIDEALSQP